MSDYTMEFHLKQLTPMLHFQAKTQGATLRPSEVKPKLDRYIYSYLKGHGFHIPNSWLCKPMEGEKTANPHYAFRYKLQLTAVGETHPDMDHIHPLYFGNLGVDTPETGTVFYAKGVKGKILFLTTEKSAPARLFGEEREFTLAEILRRLLSPFFQLHCFGTRSNKGFGSFLLDPSDEIPSVSVGDLVQYLPENCVKLNEMKPSKDGYSSDEAQLDDIDTLSKALKHHTNGYIQAVKDALGMEVTRVPAPITYHPLEKTVLILIHTPSGELRKQYSQINTDARISGISTLNIKQAFEVYRSKKRFRNSLIITEVKKANGN